MDATENPEYYFERMIQHMCSDDFQVAHASPRTHIALLVTLGVFWLTIITVTVTKIITFPSIFAHL